MNPLAPSTSPRRLSIRGTVAATLLLAVSLFLWFWTAGLYYRTLPQLSLEAGALDLGAAAIANDDGLHFRLFKDHQRWPKFRWGEERRPAYHFGMVVNLLGLVVAVQPYTHNGGDFLVEPNAALALPYWLLIVTAGYGILRFTGLAAWLKPNCRFGIAAWVVMIAVALVFVVLNAIPAADMPGGRVSEGGPPNVVLEFDKWWRLIFNPASFPDIALSYGFPFCWNEIGYINGQSVDLYYGAEMELLQHKLAENLCIALGTMLVLGLAVEWISRRWGRESIAVENIQMDDRDRN